MGSVREMELIYLLETYWETRSSSCSEHLSVFSYLVCKSFSWSSSTCPGPQQGLWGMLGASTKILMKLSSLPCCFSRSSLSLSLKLGGMLWHPKSFVLLAHWLRIDAMTSSSFPPQGKKNKVACSWKTTMTHSDSLWLTITILRIWVFFLRLRLAEVLNIASTYLL